MPALRLQGYFAKLMVSLFVSPYGTFFLVLVDEVGQGQKEV